MNLRILFLLLAGAGSVAAQQEQRMSPETLLKVKQAAVYIKVGDVEGGTGGTGSGFVFRREGEYTLIATNQHVVAGQGGRPQGPERPEDKLDPVEVVFNSGTPQELTVPAERVAVDADYDLAVLRVKLDADKVPEPIRLTSRETLSEIMPIYFFGFPFGARLGEADANPAMSVGQGYVSSVRRDKYGTMARIQIDADLNPGNSGGAVTDVHGDLVGVAVSILMGTNISFCIPAQHLRQLVDGKMSNIDFEKKFDAEAKSCSMTFKSDVLDPLGRLESATLLFAKISEHDKADVAAAQTDDGTWSAIAANLMEVPLEVKEGERGPVAEASFTLPGEKTDVYLVQARYVYKDGTDAYSSPGEIPLVGDDEEAMRIGVRTPEGEDPELNRSGANLRGARKRLGRGVFSSYEIGVDGAKTLPGILWAGDHKAIFTVQSDGVVRKIDVPSCVEDRKVELQEPCAAAALCSEGLLVRLADKPEIWLLSEKNLATKSKITAEEALLVAGSPQHSHAVVVTGTGESLAILDAANGKIGDPVTATSLQSTGSPKRHAAARDLSTFDAVAVTPDGAAVLAVSNGCVHRFGFSEGTLTLEESGPPLCDQPLRLEVSVDGKYFTVTSAEGNRPVTEGPELAPFGTYVFRVDDLAAPRVALNTGKAAHAVGLDIQEALIYAGTPDHAFATFDAKGVKGEEIAFDAGAQTRQMLVHPVGKVLFLLTDKGLYLVKALGR